MPVEWALSIVDPILKEKGDIRNCRCNRDVKLIEHGMKVVERVLERKHHRIVTVNEMKFSFMPGRGTIDTVFILRRMQKGYHAKGKKFYICIVDLEKAFDRIQRNMLQWAMSKKGIPEVMAISVISLYEGTKTRVTEYTCQKS